MIHLRLETMRFLKVIWEHLIFNDFESQRKGKEIAFIFVKSGYLCQPQVQGQSPLSLWGFGDKPSESDY